MNQKIINSFNKLKTYCEKEQFKGWDPYDGLNSKLFRATPLRKSALFRLIQIQTFKRNPINLRKLFLIKKDYNPKALGLFLTTYANLYSIDKKINISKSYTFLEINLKN